jgi:uncharacterized protein
LTAFGICEPAMGTKVKDSPCVKACLIDPECGLCVGCFRTMDEIAGWGKLSSAERRKVMATLPQRAARVGHTASPRRDE